MGNISLCVSVDVCIVCVFVSVVVYSVYRCRYVILFVSLLFLKVLVIQLHSLK